VIFEGKEIFLRDVDSADTDVLSSLVKKHLNADDDADIREHLSYMIGKKLGIFDSDIYLIVQSKNDQKIIGYILLEKIDWKNKTLVLKDYIEQDDVLLDALITALRFVFHELNLNKINIYADCSRKYPQLPFMIKEGAMEKQNVVVYGIEKSNFPDK